MILESEIVYITDCSKTTEEPMFCEHKKNELKKIHNGKTKSYRFICPNHDGRIVKRKTKCLGCGCDLSSVASGHVKERCPECIRKKMNKTNRRRNAETLRKEKERKKLEALENKNPLLCRYYESLCGFCVKPFFNCKMYSIQRS